MRILESRKFQIFIRVFVLSRGPKLMRRRRLLRVDYQLEGARKEKMGMER